MDGGRDHPRRRGPQGPACEIGAARDRRFGTGLGHHQPRPVPVERADPTSDTCCNRRSPRVRNLERDDFSSNRHPALAYCWSMIFSENRYPLFEIILRRSRNPPSWTWEICATAGYANASPPCELRSGRELKPPLIGLFSVINQRYSYRRRQP